MSARDQIVKNIWDGLEFYCMNHDEPVKMVEKRGVSTFYACPRFMLADDEHPDGHQKFEPMCKNNLSFAQAEKIVSMLADEQLQSMLNCELCSFENKILTLPSEGVHAQVLSFKPGDKRIGILNKTAMHREVY